MNQGALARAIKVTFQQVQKYERGANRLSTAVVADGILRLISTNPRRDTNEMLTPNAKKRAALIDTSKDRSPLRSAYIDIQDSAIHKLVENYLVACERTWWAAARPGSFILKTVGLQAQFDILRRLAAEAYELKDISAAYFEAKLQPAANINFADIRFRNASGSGRSMIRRTIEEAIGI